MKIIILAGGSGTRLWPLSRSSYPKQFLSFGCEESLLQKTVRRFLPEFDISDFLIMTSREYAHVVYAQLSLLHPNLKDKVVVEPAVKNTGPAIGLALRFLEEHNRLAPDEELLICPADHIIAPKERFLEILGTASFLKTKQQIATFGVRPSRPETGYGYIKTTKHEKKATFTIEQFIEKPQHKEAMAYVESGEYFWNAGLFLFTAATFWRECRICSPVLSSLQNINLNEIDQLFSEMPALSFDCAIMEKTTQGIVIPLDITWSDIGSWDSVHEYLGKDDQQNATLGNIHMVDTTNSLVIGSRRLISTLGINNMLVIDTEDALFIAQKGQSQRVKEVVDSFKLKGRQEIESHRHVYRPWGSYAILEEGERYKIKKIQVDPGERLSVQKHYHRSEHWVVIQGTAKVSIDGKEAILHENESIYVPKSSIHCLENPGKVVLEIIEVQVGEYVGEDDIVRLEDIYGRINDSSH